MNKVRHGIQLNWPSKPGRARPSRHVYEFLNGTRTTPNSNGVYTTWTECLHVSENSGAVYCDGYNGCEYWHARNANYSRYFNWSHVTEPLRSFVDIPLDFQENNTFEIIPFIVEWDETLFNFGKQIAKRLTYGRLTWEIMPTVSDFHGLYNSLKDVYSGIEDSYSKILGKKITRSRQISFVSPIKPYGFEVTLSGKLTFSGQIVGTDYPDTPMNAFNVFLDEIGFHPDIKTVWDLVPLSFVIDYFVPIGDLLDSLRARGWFKPKFQLHGGVSFSGKWILHCTDGRRKGSSSGTIFRRWSPGLFSPNPYEYKEKIDWSPPSIRQLFNTAYLKFSKGKF